MKYSKKASDKAINNAIAALKQNGIEAIRVKNGEEAKEKVLALLPNNAEVMTMTSVTLDSLGLADAINISGNYQSVRNELHALDRVTQAKEMQKLGAAPEYSVGSVHAITEDGKVLIASNTGSQLPGYVYGSLHVIWVVGAQKIVKNVDEAMKRIYDYVLPKESERAHKAYGMPGSFVSKLLIINKEVNPQRIKIFIVDEVLGF